MIIFLCFLFFLLQVMILAGWVYQWRCMARFRISGSKDVEPWPRLSVIIPAHNEAEDLPACLAGLADNEYHNLEIIIVNDRSTDATQEISEKFATAWKKDGTVTVIQNSETRTGWAGKNYALHLGYQASSGDILLFLDADTIPQPHLLQKTVSYVMDRNIDLLTLLPKPVLRSFWDRVMNIFILIPGAFLPLKRLNDRSSRMARANGPFMMFRRGAYERIGGHEQIPAEFWEDTVLAEKIKRQGLNLGYVLAPELLQLKLYTNLQALWRGWQKIEYRKLELGRSNAWFIMSGALLIMVFFCLPVVTCGYGFMHTLAGTAMIPAALILLLSLGTLVLQTVNVLIPLRVLRVEGLNHAYLLPLGAFMVSVMIFETALRFLSRKAVIWQDIHYQRSTTQLKAFIVKSDRTIDPFGDPVSESRILNTRLIDYQQKLFKEASIPVQVVENEENIKETEPYLVVKDYVFFTPALLKIFLKECYQSPYNLQLALLDCEFLSFYHHLQDLNKGEIAPDVKAYLFDFYYVVPKSESKNVRFAPLKIKEKSFRPPNLDILAPHITFTVPITTEVVFHINHWMHIIDCNHQALISYFLKLDFRRIILLGWGIIRTLRYDPLRIAGRVYRKGKKCNIHPTAVIEGSVLGDNVEVGAYTVIRGSYIGSNIKIDSHCDITFSVVANNCVVSFHTKMNFSVMYPQSLLSSPGCQTALLGSGAILTSHGFLFDMFLDRSFSSRIRVLHQGKVVDSGRYFLGPCLGHHSTVGGGVFVNPGIAIPNKTTIIKNPKHVVHKIKEAILEEGIYYNDEGALKKLEHTSPKKKKKRAKKNENTA
ncbi:glycosyltransferase [candidate division CSSED10-310 bacterium]|uniref:Glycosyltransferase n=1 Tax=candidate division CSSED10-310 bacterium TaxID=2855610 RepID=A0ABV6YWT7_UNCC1